MYRYGLSAREVRLLGMLAARLRLNEISAQRQVSRDRVKTYFRRMIDKLALDGQQSLVSFANEKMAHCTPATSGFVPLRAEWDTRLSGM